jgi:hypothetical protein
MTSAQVIAQLKQIQQQSVDALKKAEFTVVNNIALTAIELAPEDTSQLMASIRVEQDSTGSSVIVGAPYSGWVEFGTGPVAYADYISSLPDEWKAEAEKFFVTGKGHGAPHPFFYPAVQLHENDIYAEVDKELSKLAQ